MKIHLIDGTFELFRCYYAAPSMLSRGGQEVGAVKVFSRSMRAFLEQGDVTHVGIAFDTVIESFRNDLFEYYKTGEGMDPDLFAQFPLAEQAAAALGMNVWSMIDLEADDGLSSGADRYKNRTGVEQVIICTPDKDLMQMVEGEHVVTWDRLRSKVYDEKGVMEKFGVKPKSIPDYLALVGDSADGIPGIEGWGATSTSSVLGVYDHLESIPNDPGLWKIKVRGATRLSKNLNNCWEDALLYRKLATLRVDAKIPDDPKEIEWKGIDKDALTAFNSLIS